MSEHVTQPETITTAQQYDCSGWPRDDHVMFAITVSPQDFPAGGSEMSLLSQATANYINELYRYDPKGARGYFLNQVEKPERRKLILKEANGREGQEKKKRGKKGPMTLRP